MATITVTRRVAGVTVSKPPVSKISVATVVRLTPTSSGGAGYQHDQPSASAEWIVNHNLGYRPGVSVFTTGGQEVDAAVLHISVNQVRISFLEPFAGFARLV